MWGRIMWLWDRPTFQRLRIAFSMANISVRLPAIIALVGTQIGLLATQVSRVTPTRRNCLPCRCVGARSKEPQLPCSSGHVRATVPPLLVRIEVEPVGCFHRHWR